ncbi:DUF4833 domain-containing protein [Pustulibacterium marinum]|nr:DUF4833 domain-containing protein [Pustulibacterium marinum]
MFRTYLLILGLLYFGAMKAQDGYPVPPKNGLHLFYIQHSDNKNTYVYDARMDGNNLDADDPVEEYRILYSDKGETKPLTTLQRKFAYGLKIVSESRNNYVMHLTASKELELHLILYKSHPKVYTTINNHKLFITRIFIKLKEGTSGLGAKMDYVLFEGFDYNTGKAASEKKYAD